MVDRLEDFKGDKRSKEYKELKKQLESDTPPPFKQEDYDRIKNYGGLLPKEDFKWFWRLYDKTFNTKSKPCLCPGKIRKMRIKLIKTFEKWQREK